MTHPIHPIIVHFPIALLFTAVFFDLLGLLIQKEGLRRAGLYLLIMGILSGVVAVIAGEWSEEMVEAMGVPEEAIENHELFAYLSLISFSVLLVLRWGFRGHWSLVRNQVIYFIVAMASLSLLAITGYYGGELVFKHGAGVEAVKPSEAPAPPAEEPANKQK